MPTVAIVQARMSSTRLPGKALVDLAGQPALARVVRRLRRAALLDEVAVATSIAPADDVLIDECRRLDVPVVRGSEADVLARYVAAARARNADLIVRITADCPLIDPALVDQVVGAFLQERPDYAANTLQRTWPRGLDTEAFSRAALDRAAREAAAPYERAHVTPYFYQHPERFRLLSVTGSEDASNHRWTLDTPEDFAFLRAVYERLPADDAFTWQDVLHLLHAEPALLALNQSVRQKDLHEG